MPADPVDAGRPDAARIDVVTIFPEYLAPLELSLVGKARADGLLDVVVHDLRDWTSDRHRTVDDTPAGGGAGMVMRPDIWGLALDDVLGAAVPDDALSTQGRLVDETGGAVAATLLVPTPAGRPLTQAFAGELAADLTAGSRLVIACGRYEGIDARVVEHYSADPRVRVRELSIGDYVLNGGEAAALVVVEAVARLLPGVIGNPASLVEESHGAAGLIEGPVYTRPLSWRGHDVPDVLRSGHHGRIARWRRDRALDRTAALRPDLLERLDPASLDREDRATLAGCGWLDGGQGHLVRFVVRRATPDDAEALAALSALTFPLACPPEITETDVAAYVAEHLSAQRWALLLADTARHTVLIAHAHGVRAPLLGYTLAVVPSDAEEPPATADVAAAVRERPVAELSKCYVMPEMVGTGLAGALLEATHAELSARVVGGRPLAAVWLGTNRANRRAQRFYRRHGYRPVGRRAFRVGEAPQEDVVMLRTLPGAGSRRADGAG